MAEKRTSKKGRPEWKPTEALRRKVSIWAGGGMSQEDIAMGLGIDRNTLVKHCSGELSKSAFERRQEIIQAMYQAAKKGSVTAQKAYLAMVPDPIFPLIPGPDDMDSNKSGKGQLPLAGGVGKVVPVGKKEQANLDAVGAEVGTDWHELLNSGDQLQ